MFLKTQEDEVWNMVMDGPYILTTVIKWCKSTKSGKSWTDDDNKKVLYDKKEKNIIVFAL